MINASSVQKIMLRGRSRDTDEISALLAGAAAGHGGARLFHGEPGIGRTSLLRFAAAEAVDFAVVDLDGGARPDQPGADAPDTTSFAGLRRLLAALADRGADVGPASALLDGPDHHRFALSVAMLGAVRGLAARRPVLCRVDDAHDLDRETLDVLGFVSRRLDSERVAVIVTSRGGAGSIVAGVPHRRLGPLDQRDSRQVIDDRTRRVQGSAGDVAAVLAAIAEGNPRALVELAESLTPAQCRGAAPPPVTLPRDSRLRRTYRARLAALPGHTRWLLLLAAADRDLDADELGRAAYAGGLDLAGLEPAEAAGLIAVTGGTVAFPEPLVRTVVYHEADPSTRRAAHRTLAGVLTASNRKVRRNLHLATASTGADAALATALERAAGEPDAGHGPASLALERAAGLTPDPELAAGRLIAAARQAWLGGEPHRVRLLLGRLPAGLPAGVTAQADLLAGEVELRTGTPEQAQGTLLRAAARLTDRDRRLALAALVRAGEAACLAGDYARYPEVARRAGALRQPDEPPALELIFEQFAGQAALFQGRHAAAVGPLRRVFALAARLDDAGALTSASGAAILLGDDARAARLANRAAEVARATGNRSILPQALDYAAVAEFALGRYDTASQTLLEGLLAARESGQENLVSTNLATLAVLAAIAGDRQTCLLRVREARSRLRAGVGPAARARVMTDWALAVLDLFDHRPTSAFSRLRSVVRPGGDLMLQVAAAPHLVEAAAGCGDRTAARRAVDLFDPWASSTGNPGWLALAARSRALATADEYEATEHFRTALGHHVADGGGFERARTELLLGERLRGQRRPGAATAARQHLRNALEMFERFDSRPWRDRTAATLKTIGDADAPGRPVPTPSSSLTPQQMQIARMVADGATNQEVAARLFLSRRTVEYHMRNIFLRLGVRSRVELVKLVS